MLAQVAGEFGEEWRSLLIIRLTEVALLVGRRDLVDNAALTALVKAAQSSFGVSYDPLLRWIVRNLSDDEVLLKYGRGRLALSCCKFCSRAAPTKNSPPN